MTNAATWMPEKRTQTPSPSPDLIPAKTINRKLTLKLAHQMGALHEEQLNMQIYFLGAIDIRNDAKVVEVALTFARSFIRRQVFSEANQGQYGQGHHR